MRQTTKYCIHCFVLQLPLFCKQKCQYYINIYKDMIYIIFVKRNYVAFLILY